jgi:hypothetical protein
VSAAARFWRINSTSEHDPNIKQVKKQEFKKAFLVLTHFKLRNHGFPEGPAGSKACFVHNNTHYFFSTKRTEVQFSSQNSCGEWSDLAVPKPTRGRRQTPETLATT